MGKVILCSGKIASIPYTFTGSNISVYSIEEMSYYLYTHIYEIYEDFLSDSLIQWVRIQVALPNLADKLLALKTNNNNLKDIIVTILCSNDYYTEKEVKEIIQVLDRIMGLPRIKRRKIRGDYFMKYAMYHNALEEYESILQDSEIKTFTEVEYGNLLHNIGIVYVHIISYQEASMYFKEAYQRNQSEASLHQFMLTMLLAGNEEAFEKERIHYQLPVEYKELLYKQLNQKEEEVVSLPLYSKYKKIVRLRAERKEEEYQTEVAQILSNWKSEYRRQVEV